MADVIAMLPMILGNLVLFMADVIAMLPCFVVDVIPLVDVLTYLYGSGDVITTRLML